MQSTHQPFKEKIDAQPGNVMQHVALFRQQCKETGIIEDFNFVINENLPAQDIDMFNTINRTA
jgi:hypothetical protein